jgi:hypothetical protein
MWFSIADQQDHRLNNFLVIHTFANHFGVRIMKTAKLNQELLEQYILAGSPEVTSEQLRTLADHFCDKIRLRVAENPKTSAELLFNLSRDANHDVRVAVAGNSNCDRSTLIRLLRDDDVVVRHGIAQNISTPLVLLEYLATDENGWVRGEAIKTLEIIEGNNVRDEVADRRQMKQENARQNIRSFDRQSTENEAVS